MEKQGKVFRLMTHPAIILLGVVLGVLTGVYFKTLVPYLTSIGESYVSLLIMSLLPIVFTSIILGLAKFLHGTNAYRNLGRIIVVFIIGLLLVSSISVVGGLLVRPKIELQTHTEYSLGKLIKSVEYYPQQINGKSSNTGRHVNLSNFLRKVTPSNVIADLGEGITIKIVLIALLLGIALGKIKGDATKQMLQFVELINQIFHHVFKWILYVLPFGLICIFAHRVTLVDVSLLRVLLRFVLLFYFVAVILLLIFNVIISHASKKHFWSCFWFFRQPLLLAFIMESVFIPLPATLSILDKLKFDNEIVEMVMPLGLMMNRYGKVVLLTLLTLLIAGFYGVQLNFVTVVVIMLINIIAGLAIPGPAIMLVPAFAAVAAMLGVPSALGVVILGVIDPLVSRMMSTVTLYGNCAAVSLVANGGRNDKDD